MFHIINQIMALCNQVIIRRQSWRNFHSFDFFFFSSDLCFKRTTLYTCDHLPIFGQQFSRLAHHFWCCFTLHFWCFLYKVINSLLMLLFYIKSIYCALDLSFSSFISGSVYCKIITVEEYLTLWIQPKSVCPILVVVMGVKYMGFIHQCQPWHWLIIFYKLTPFMVSLFQLL